MITITRIESFSSAHRLFESNKCSAIHGHNYKVEISLKGNISSKTGMLMDTSHLKEIIWTEALSALDQQNIDDIPYFFNTPSTCENVNFYLWSRLYKKIPLLYSIKLWETDKINTYCTKRDYEEWMMM